MKTVEFTDKDIKCLRGHLNAIEEILQKHGQGSGSKKGPEVAPKETKAQRITKYKNLIGSGARATKPTYLKKN